MWITFQLKFNYVACILIFKEIITIIISLQSSTEQFVASYWFWSFAILEPEMAVNILQFCLCAFKNKKGEQKL